MFFSHFRHSLRGVTATRLQSSNLKMCMSSILALDHCCPRYFSSTSEEVLKAVGRSAGGRALRVGDTLPNATTSEWLVLDSCAVLHFMGILEHVTEDHPLSHCIFLHTVLGEVKYNDLSIFKRLCTLLAAEDRHHVVFANLNLSHTETITPQISQIHLDETTNDRNDRSIRIATQWLQQQHAASTSSIILITNDRENKRLAIEEGIETLSMQDYISQRAGIYPETADFAAAKRFVQRLERVLDIEGQDAALHYFVNKYLSKESSYETTGKVNTMQCKWVMKNLCTSSKQIQSLIEHMKIGGIPVDVGTLNNLIRQFLFEKNVAAAQHVLDVRFRSEDLTPNDQTHEYLNKADSFANAGYIQKKKRLLETCQTLLYQDVQKQIKRSRGENLATAYFQKTIANGLGNTQICNWAMHHLYATSIEIRTLMKVMIENNISFDVGTLNALIRQYLFENNMVAAQHVFHVEFTTEELTPNDQTHAYLKDADAFVFIALKRLMHKKGTHHANLFFTEIITNGQGNSAICHWAMLHLYNNTSNEMRLLMKVMKDHHIPLDVGILNVLIQQYLLENNLVAAQQVLNADFAIEGLEPNDTTHRTLKDAEQLAEKGNKKAMERVLKKELKLSVKEILANRIHLLRKFVPSTLP